jgi:predicted dehydrogenase
MRTTNRRAFIGTTAATVAASGIARNAFAGGSADDIKVGIVGCGGRGSGAAENVLEAAKGVRIVACADLFAERTQSLRKKLSDFLMKDGPAKSFGNRCELNDDNCFTGLEAYKKVVASDANYIILATPPGFRPMHLESAVAAGKNIFTEKPVAVDGPGIRRVLALEDEVNKKGLAVVAGTQRRHNAGYIATIKQIHEGAIGDVTALRAYWNNPGIWFHKRQPGMSDAHYQLYNWYHFLWICGDHIVEQHVHNLDVCNWIMKTHPVRCDGAGSRTPGNPSRPTGTPEEVGNIYDNFSIDYEYPGGVHMYSSCRHLAPCASNVSEVAVGTKGVCKVNAFTINGKKVDFKFPEKRGDYIQEHTDLIESIRNGKPLNELRAVAESTLTAIMGRMAAYTGRPVTWDQALNSQEDTFPKDLDMKGTIPVPPVPVPGKNKLI